MASDVSAALSSLRIDRSRPRAGRTWWLAVVVVVLLAATSAAIAAARPYLEAMLLTTPVSTTKITLVSPLESATLFSASGYARTDAVSRVSPRVSGLVRAVHVKQGDQVERNQLLYELDPATLKASIATSVNERRAASAAATGGRARATMAAAELEETRLKVERERRLAEEGLSPTGVADDLAASLTSSKQRVLAAEAEADAAAARATALESRTQELRAGLNDLAVVSPIPGTIVDRPPQVGEHINPFFNYEGIRVADLSQIVIQVDVPEVQLAHIRGGGPAEITLEAYPNKRFRGQVRHVMPEVDRGKATVPVKVAFLDEVTGVLPDMSARVSFLNREEDAKAIREPPKKMVSAAAVTQRGEANVIFVVETNVVRMVRVKLGSKVGNSFELIDGPPAGSMVVTDPAPALAHGQRVKSAP